jgi:hypothetical protein
MSPDPPAVLRSICPGRIPHGPRLRIDQTRFSSRMVRTPGIVGSPVDDMAGPSL